MHCLRMGNDIPKAKGHTRLLEIDWCLITLESHYFSCGSVKTWNTVNEAVEKNISFGKIIELDKFMTKEEIKQIQDKRRIF